MGSLRRTSLLLLPLLVADLWAAPLTKYDQRQEGELNVHAHLENFVILLIPGGSGLFNFAAKIAGGKHHSNKHVKAHAEGGSKHVPEEQSVAVPVGIKSPPYKVDIDADRRTPIILEITAPRVSEEQHEVVIAESPMVTFTKTQTAEKENSGMDTEKSEPEKPESEKPSMQMDSEEKPSDDAEKPSDDSKKPSDDSKNPSDDAGKPSSAADKPKESPEKPQNAPAPAKSEAIKPLEKPSKKPVEAPAAAPAASAAAAADQKEVAAPSDAERPAVPAKPAVAPVAADSPASLAGEPAQPPKQVAQEAKSRAGRLELLRTGLVPSAAEAPCSTHEVRDGRCGRALPPIRVAGNYEDAALLKALRFGLAPAN